MNRSGAHMIRDFVRFIHDFEAAGGRESEGQIDDSADAVRLMTIHQAKGLEFPVVILPELHRQADVRTEWHHAGPPSRAYGEDIRWQGLEGGGTYDDRISAGGRNCGISSRACARSMSAPLARRTG